MSAISNCIERLKREESAFIFSNHKQHTDSELRELLDCILAHPHGIAYIDLLDNHLTDESGVKLAQAVATSTTIEWLNIECNRVGEATYLAFAAALRVNTSLVYLTLRGNLPVERTRVEAAFVDALRVNRALSMKSTWYLHSLNNDFKRLRREASARGHPTLQMLLIDRVDGALKAFN